jgi:16S rRNA (uracil1498-N3)-methyltransferase
VFLRKQKARLEQGYTKKRTRRESNAMTRRRWIADRWDEATATLDGAEAAHLARVLRAEPGMQADVVAGGHVYSAEVAAVTLSEVRFNLITELEADPALPLILVLAVYKFDHMEWAIEKATELGVAAIAPVIARRTEKHLAQAAAKRVERWRKIAHEAAKQSRRSDVPEVLDPEPLATHLRQATADVRLVLAEQERTTTLRHTLDEILAVTETQMPQMEMAVGPEGGWAPEEEALFDSNGWRAVSLGPRILRAETAAITALAVAAAYLE